MTDEHSEDPRDTDTGQGYPEEGPPGSSPGEHAEERERTDAQNPGRAPETSSDEDGEPDQATGNPGAAGG
jgi:hypothetical protein